MLDRPYDWLPHYPRPAFANDTRSTGTRTPISPLSANNSFVSLPRPGWVPSAPASSHGDYEPSLLQTKSRPHHKSSMPQQYRHLSTPAKGSRSSRGSRYTGSISSRGSFGVAQTGEVVKRSEVVQVHGQSNDWTLSEESLRSLEDQHGPQVKSTSREPYNLSYGELPIGQAPPVEPKVLIDPSNRARESQSSVTPLVDHRMSAVELPGSPPPVHRRSMPLMEAANYRLSMPLTDSTYKHDSFDEYNLAVELEGDTYKVHELPAPLSHSAYSASAAAESPADVLETRHTRNFSRLSAEPAASISRGNMEAEKGDLYLNRSSAEKRKKWMIIAIVVLIIVIIALAATIGGVLGK